MKTTKLIIMFLGLLLTAQAAFAWYDPSTQRWLTRDPIGEPGFQLRQAATAIPQLRQSQKNKILSSPSRWITRDPISKPSVDKANLYVCVVNNPISHFDPVGLNDWGSPKPTHPKPSCNTTNEPDCKFLEGTPTGPQLNDAHCYYDCGGQTYYLYVANNNGECPEAGINKNTEGIRLWH